MLRSVVFYSLLTILIFVVLNSFSSPHIYHSRYKSNFQQMQSPLHGWHSRTTPYTAPTQFTPTSSTLKLAILRSTPTNPQGFTLALFDSSTTSNSEGNKIAVDASGRILVVQDSDFSGLLALAERTNDLPPTGKFRNTWVIKQPTTSQPIDRILLPISSPDESINNTGQKYNQTSVQGFDGVNTLLKDPVDGIRELPRVLQDLVGLVLEAREGAGDGGRDDDVIGRVRVVLGDV